MGKIGKVVGWRFLKADKFSRRATPRFVKFLRDVGQGPNERLAAPGLVPEPQPRLPIGGCPRVGGMLMLSGPIIWISPERLPGSSAASACDSTWDGLEEPGPV